MNEGRRRLLLQLASAAGFLAIVAVAVLIVVNANQTSSGDENLEGVGQTRRELRGIPQSGLVLGRESAKVTLIEYGDLQCPVCKAFAEEILPPVIESKVRDGKAKIEFRNYTIIGSESIQAGAAAIAAGQQGRGWSFIELFYRNQGLENSGYVTNEFLTTVARAAGVKDLGRWNHDRKAPSTVALVSRTSDEAQRLGFSGTPSFAAVGPRSGFKPLGTPSSAAELEEAIDAAG